MVNACIYGKFDFPRPDIGGNKPANGKCLARKARDKEVCLYTEGRQCFPF